MLSACFSGDLTEGVVATSAATLWHVDLAKRSRTALLSAHPAPVLALAASPADASLVASACADGALRVWQVSAGEVRSGYAP